MPLPPALRRAALASAKPTPAQVDDQTRRAQQAPLINEAQVTANAGLDQPPIGSMLMWPSLILPRDAKWLPCDGAILNQLLYPELFSYLGTTWNTGGETAEEFRVPNMGGRTPVGTGAGTGLTARTLADKWGAELHSLTSDQNGPHDHTGFTENNTHNHGGDTSVTETRVGLDVFAGNYQVVQNVTPYHTDVVNNDTHRHIINPSGLGSAHNNMQPSMALIFIIRALL